MHKLELPIKTERYTEIKAHWLNECEKNAPTYCKTYGTKMRGGITLEHYMFWVMIKGGSLSKVTHNQRSKKFIKAFNFLNDALIRHNNDVSSAKLSLIGKPFGMDNFEVAKVIESYT